MPSFYLKIAGVTFEGRQRLISDLSRKGKLNPGTLLRLVAEPDNPYDSNAVKVMTIGGDTLGYIPKQHNSTIAYNLRIGKQYKVTVSAVTGGDELLGVNIMLEY